MPVADLRVKDFVMPGSYSGMGVGPGGHIDVMLRPILRRFNRMPRPKAGRCTLCAVCEGSCPVKAITMNQEARAAEVDDSLCIRCYCCHEVCPSAAIDLELTGVAGLLHKLRMV